MASGRSNRFKLNHFRLSPKTIAWIDISAIAAWGVLLLEYWINQKLGLLIHPAYDPLSVMAGVMLLTIAAYRTWTLIQQNRSGQPLPTALPTMQHLSLLPNGVGSFLLLIVALLAIVITPQPFNSQTAIQRGVGDIITNTQVKPQAFRGNHKSEDRSLIDWMRTLQVSPEPDNYAGQKAKIKGFVVYPDNFPKEYFRLTRFIVTCCAADAYPVSLPVKLTNGDRTQYKPDSWFEVEGQIVVETIGNQRQIVVQASQIKAIPQPIRPYDY
jgi:uncharacterized repeat protein (TIGR03943 family)